MTSGPHRRGRRDNGLEASAYAAAADVDPRVGEHLLDVLGLAGIAAYLQPAADLHPVTRTTMLPNRPTDRLFVDRDHLAEARGFLDQLRSDDTAADRPKPTRATPRRGGDPGPGADPSEPGDPGQSGKTGGGETPGAADPTRPAGGFADATRSAGDTGPAEPPGQSAGAGSGSGTVSGGTEPGDGTDVEAEWARIVAEFDAPLDAPIPPWPVAEDVPDQPEPADGGGPGDPTGPRDPDDPRDPAGRADGETDRSAADRGGVERPPGWRAGAQRPLIESLDADDPFEPEDEGYEPPPPPPIPKPSRYTAVALLAIGAGLVLFFWPGLLTSIGFGEKLTLGLGVLGILVGFGTLVWRLRSGDDEEDEDPDDGAVV